MKDLNKIAGFNLLFIIVYAVVLRIACDKSTVLFASMFLVVVQVLANLITAISYYAGRKSELGNSYLLTTFLVLIVGFGACVTAFNAY